MQIADVSMGSRPTGMPSTPRSFASDNGVALPEPSKGPAGGARRGGPPPSGAMPPAGAPGPGGQSGGAPAARGASSGAGSSSAKDVTTQSDADLEKAAREGDQKAIAELERREAIKARSHEQSVLDTLDAVRLGAASGA